MTFLLAFLLVMGLPWVETNVTLTGRVGISEQESLRGVAQRQDPEWGSLLIWGSPRRVQARWRGPWCVPSSLLSLSGPPFPGDVELKAKPRGPGYLGLSSPMCENVRPNPPVRSHTESPDLVPRVLVRFFYVSRQCTRFCPLIRPNDMVLKSFILVKPMPFLYAACCRKPLCNSQQPVITDTEWKYGKQYGGAWDRRSGSAGLVLTLTSVSLGLRWS
ncbi:lymphocyte antigen 6K-like [Saccopteryx bilineata]|uniref:lymphocyte antigen 6K-like n=1 Tax=Saccopteryx bilineata TaxID=59482 RepID=UPI00338E188A